MVVFAAISISGCFCSDIQCLLPANMIGVEKNIIIVNMGFIDLVMFNPVIVSKSGLFEMEEGEDQAPGFDGTDCQHEMERYTEAHLQCFPNIKSTSS